MLILPLHRPLTRQTFPLVTALLIVVNVFVFAVLQAGDDARIATAIEHYVDGGLGTLEAPAFERYLIERERKADLAQLQELPAEHRQPFIAMSTQTDVDFVQRLHRGELFEDASAQARWMPLRAQYERLQGDVFTLRHLLRSNEVDPWRMLSAAFLHGGFGHLFGNMMFLAALGLLVEGALGGWRYLALYLLGAIGASAASLLWRWGDAGGGLGASGAIAALMGAFCVIWGRRPVRFFYWFGVVFDYVRKPAIWLLPLWLGWEVYNLIANDELNIGFDAHAGGIVSGALLGAALVALGQTREDFMREDDPDHVIDDRWERAQAHLGRMQLADADALLVSLQQDQPARFDIALARLRAASNGGDTNATRARAVDLLQLRAADNAQVQAQVAALSQAGLAATAPVRVALVQRSIALSAFDAAEALLLDTRVPIGSAALWFQLGLKRQSSSDAVTFTRTLQRVVGDYPASPEATKARFLLDNA